MTAGSSSNLAGAKLLCRTGSMRAMEAENRTWNKWSRSLSSMLVVASPQGHEGEAQYVDRR